MFTNRDELQSNLDKTKRLLANPSFNACSMNAALIVLFAIPNLVTNFLECAYDRYVVNKASLAYNIADCLFAHIIQIYTISVEPVNEMKIDISQHLRSLLNLAEFNMTDSDVDSMTYNGPNGYSCPNTLIQYISSNLLCCNQGGLFGLQVTTTRTCLNCNEVSQSSDRLPFLSVDLTQTTMQEVLDNEFHPQNGEEFACTSCTKLLKAQGKAPAVGKKECFLSGPPSEMLVSCRRRTILDEGVNMNSVHWQQSVIVHMLDGSQRRLFPIAISTWTGINGHWRASVFKSKLGCPSWLNMDDLLSGNLANSVNQKFLAEQNPSLVLYVSEDHIPKQHLGLLDVTPIPQTKSWANITSSGRTSAQGHSSKAGPTQSQAGGSESINTPKKRVHASTVSSPESHSSSSGTYFSLYRPIFITLDTCFCKRRKKV